METIYIAYAVPFFFLLIGIEISVALARGGRKYRLGPAISDIGCGIVQQVLLLFLSGAALAGYIAIYTHLRIATLPNCPLTFAIAFICVDLLYYAWHRASHEVNLLWAAHAIHHQSEEFNLAVALRQSILTVFTSQLFYLPLAFVGISPVLLVAVNAANTLYQFWIHTELVGRLGSFEAWLNTPSHHRVHHGTNPAYLDKNYGATLIVWDRLFGTFVRETEPPVYGLVKPFHSYDPVWAQLAPLVALGSSARRTKGILGKLRVLFGSPARLSDGAAPPPESEGEPHLCRTKYDPEATLWARVYAFLQFTVAVLATAAMLFGHDSTPRTALAVAAGLVLFTLSTSAAFLEGRPDAPYLEVVRLVLVAVATMVAVRWGLLPSWTGYGMVPLCAGMAGVMVWIARGDKADLD